MGHFVHEALAVFARRGKVGTVSDLEIDGRADRDRRIAFGESGMRERLQSGTIGQANAAIFDLPAERRSSERDFAAVSFLCLAMLDVPPAQP
jgi:hypothetical protein